LHDSSCSFEKTAVASFTGLRPAAMPARKNKVRRCCLTVRRLMGNSLAISLVAATLHQKSEDPLIARRDFDFV